MLNEDEKLKLESYANNDKMRIEYEGKIYYSLEGFGELCGYSKHDSYQVYSRNEIYFTNQVVFVKWKVNNPLAQVEPIRSHGSKIFLTEQGLYVFISKLELERLDERRQKFIIGAVNYMAESAVMRRTGQLHDIERREQIQEDVMMRNEIHTHMIPVISENRKKWVYIHYAKLIHHTVFGYHINGMRKDATTKQLQGLKSVISWLAVLIHQGEFEYNIHKTVLDEMFQEHYPDLYEAREERKRLINEEKKHIESEKRKAKQLLEQMEEYHGE